MERQLKERLIGAAVLIAAAVVLVPEMFSGSASRVAATDDLVTATNSSNDADSSATSGQLKTYHIQLQDRGEGLPAPAEAEASSAAAVAEAPTGESSSSEESSVSLAEAAASPSSPPPSSAPKSIAKPIAAPSASSSAASKRAEAKTSVELARKPAGSDGKGWVVQIGSFGSDAKAKQIASSLKAKNFPAYSAPVTAHGKTLYRVRLGPLAERSEADALLKKLKSTYPDASVVPQSR